MSPQTQVEAASAAQGSSYVKEQKAFKELSYLDPTDEMNKRWLKLLQKKTPTIDLVDISAEVEPFNSYKRQFAPEYSHSAYRAMLKAEYSVGDYLQSHACTLQMTNYTRQQMVKLIEDFVLLKKYKTETLYHAVSLADRYLVNLAVEGRSSPCLITLAVVCTLMAAKLNQPIAPSFNRMIALLHEEHDTLLAKQDLLNMEETIIRSLDFNLQHTSPIPFLERFLRIFNLDQGRDKSAHLIKKLARNYIKFMQRESCFLDYQPSQIASAALLFAINITQSPVAKVCGVENIEDLKLKSLFFGSAIYMEIGGVKVEEEDQKCPLRMWNSAVEKLTYIQKERDVEPCYSRLVGALNSEQYKGKLSLDPLLFVQKEENR